ncbi:protein involved in Mo-molybdopterin cofactor metabolic process [Arthrobacter sp. Hiyo8]|nr:protein involved in Mo-molybdopterin cofactor metabolic process [Arthrobacter sp. Hiyo8]
MPIEQALPDVFPVPGVPATVRLPTTEPGTFVRDAGSDITAGTVALHAGTASGPGNWGCSPPWG